MIELQKYNEGQFILPSVVDVINYESHIVLDIIQLKGELFKKDDHLKWAGEEVVVFKKLKDHPIQTELSIQNRLEIRKVRYFCNKMIVYDKENKTAAAE